MIWRSNLDCRRQIEDDPVKQIWACTSPSRLHGIAKLNDKFGLCLSERLWAVFKSELCAIFCRAFVGELAKYLSVFDREIGGLLFRVFEHDVAEERGGGVVHVYDGLFAACDGINSPLDQVFPSGSENL